SALWSGEHACCPDRPKRAIRCGGDPVQAVIGIWGVRTRNKIPLRAIPVFSQRELGAALKWDNILASCPDVVARQGDDANEHRIGRVGIKARGRNNVPTYSVH